MSRYDGLIIPRSYSEYVNKTDAATLSQALALPGVMDAAPTESSNKAARSGGIYNAIDAVKPVDTIALNNMHAITSNAVSRAMSYSTEEVDTGKKWIDGKPIYRKTFNIGNLPNNTAKVINFSISNLNDIVMVEGIANTTNIVLPIPYTSPDNTERITVYVAKVWGNITVNTISDMSTYYGCIILEYTKTND